MEDSNAESRLETLKARRDQCQVRTSSLRARLEDHQKSLGETRERIKDLTKEIAAAEVPNLDLKRQLSKLQTDVAFFETVLGEVKDNLLPKAEEELKETTLQFEDAYIAAMRLRRQVVIEDFKRLIGDMEDFKEKWKREILDSMKEYGVEGGMKILTELRVEWNDYIPGVSGLDLALTRAMAKIKESEMELRRREGRIKQLEVEFERRGGYVNR